MIGGGGMGGGRLISGAAVGVWEGGGEGAL